MSWNARFAGEDYLYGKAPAAFVAAQAWRIVPGSKVLSVAEGEGRNAVFLAEQGAAMTALEAAPNARAKALKLAQERGVKLDLVDVDLRAFTWPEADYDAVLACYIQFADPAFRAKIFDGLARALKPGGLVLIHGFAKRQPRYGTGGPGVVDQLYDLDLLRDAFPRWDVLYQADYDGDLDEGAGHSGRAALVDFVAQKPMR